MEEYYLLLKNKHSVKVFLGEILNTITHIPLLLCVSISFVSVNKPFSFLTIKSKFKQGEFHTSPTEGC